MSSSRVGPWIGCGTRQVPSTPRAIMTTVPSTIQELDETSDECLQLLPRSLPDVVVSSGQDEGDGPLPRLGSDASSVRSRYNTGGSSRQLQQHGNSSSLERLIDSLVVRARICVYLIDNSPVDFIPVGGYQCKCPEMIECVIKARSLDRSQAEQALAVWFTDEADELQVQLKNDHNPFVIQRYWKYFLRKYSECPDVKKSNVVLYVKRSVFLPIRTEITFNDPRLIHLLFEEAQQRFLDRQYSFSQEDAIMLGVLLIYKLHDRYIAGSEFLSNINLEQFFPAGYLVTEASSRKTKSDNLDDLIRETYRGLSARSLDEIRLRFLLICRENPLYGAVFFQGQIYAPPRSKFIEKIVGKAGAKIRVAVNERGLFLLSSGEFPETLIGLDYDEFTFRYHQPPDEAVLADREIARLLLIIRIPFTGEDGTVQNVFRRQLIIFSKQAVLIHACMSTFVHKRKAARFRRRESQINGDELSDAGSSDVNIVGGSSEDVVEGSTLSMAVRSNSKRTIRPVKSSYFSGLTNHFERVLLHPVASSVQ